jgi:predicted PurR-regulated permease PerM
MNGEDKRLKPDNDPGMGLMKNRTGRVVVTVIVLTLIFVTFWSMMDLVILTFISTFIFYHFQKVLHKGFAKTPIGDRVPPWLTLILVYCAGILIVVLFAWSFLTIIVNQTQEIAGTLKGFDFNSVKNQLDPQVAALISDLNINEYLNTLFDKIGSILLDLLGSIGRSALYFVLSIAISFLFLLEKASILRFGGAVEKSSIGFIYKYFMKFGANFIRTFAKVMKVQVTIALANSLLSMILLTIIGMPSVLGLGVMIFALGLIPVAGVIISIIPMAIIAFNAGGFIMVLEILIMVAALHAVEAYVLNPRLMAHRTALPIPFVFVILIVAEQYLRVWGLLIGVPIFIFLMSIFQVDYEEVCRQPETKWGRKFRAFRAKHRK